MTFTQRKLQALVNAANFAPEPRAVCHGHGTRSEITRATPMPKGRKCRAQNISV
eukprot:COSAG02_NODE_63987_length_261_cov_2.549383_2_plen_53_part_01